MPRQQPGVVIPDESMVFDETGLHVLVVQDGRVHAKPINIYRDFGTTAELREGLSGGEELVVNPPADLNEGQGQDGCARKDELTKRLYFRAGKAFFFEKKKQKTFVSAVAVMSGERATAESKFFGPFFQKRTACFL